MLLGSMLLGAILATALSGCIEYTERVSCSNGTVLDEAGECVAPPVPDGGVAIETCADLCAMIPGWSADEVACLQTNLQLAGPLPAECMSLTSTSECEACVAAVGASDTSCALSRSCVSP